MGSKENNPALVGPSNFQGPRILGRIIDQRLRDVHNITRKECPTKDAAECKKNVPDLPHRPQQPKETKEVSVSSFAANPKAVQDVDQEAKKPK